MGANQSSALNKLLRTAQKDQPALNASSVKSRPWATTLTIRTTVAQFELASAQSSPAHFTTSIQSATSTNDSIRLETHAAAVKLAFATVQCVPRLERLTKPPTAWPVRRSLFRSAPPDETAKREPLNPIVAHSSSVSATQNTADQRSSRTVPLISVASSRSIRSPLTSTATIISAAAVTTRFAKFQNSAHQLQLARALAVF